MVIFNNKSWIIFLCYPYIIWKNSSWPLKEYCTNHLFILIPAQEEDLHLDSPTFHFLSDYQAHLHLWMFSIYHKLDISFNFLCFSSWLHKTIWLYFSCKHNYKNKTKSLSKLKAEFSRKLCGYETSRLWSTQPIW